MSETFQDVVDFWRTAGPARWFAKDDAFDAEFRERFFDKYHQAAQHELTAWADTPEGALALVLLLDQFPRNCFRGDADAFATDALARAIADRAIAAGFDRAVDAGLRLFFYLPLEHSENIADQQRAVALCRELGDADYLKYAGMHCDVIARFGRFPHRNAVLGRDTTPEEQAFLDTGGFAG